MLAVPARRRAGGPPLRCWSRTTGRRRNAARENFRMVSDGPSTARGGITALTREPSGSRASTIGDDSSTRRPTRQTIRSMTWRSCASEVKRALVAPACLQLDPDLGAGRSP